MELRFYEWFLAELIAALRALNLQQQQAERHIVTAVTAAGQRSTFNGATVITARQSNLVARPGMLMNVMDGTHALGDTNRHRQFLDPLQGGFVPTQPPWTIPPPPSPRVSLSCGVSWNAAQTSGPFGLPYRLPGWPSFPGLEAEDHHIETVYEREDFDELSGSPTDVDYPPAEVTGVYVQPDWQRPRQEAYPRLDHLAYRRRPSVRMPYMAGVDGDGHYLRVVIIPMKTCREDSVFIPT